MKKSFTLIGLYFLLLVFGTALFASIFMISADLTTVVTGQNISFFSLPFFLEGIQLSFPLACMVSFVLLIMYLIRHPGKQIAAMITYAVLGILTWTVMLPIDLKSFETSDDVVAKARKLTTSTGVFRKEGRGVYLFTNINEDGTVAGVYIDVNGFSDPDGNVLTFERLEVQNENAFPYSDVLIKDSIQPPQFVTYPLAVYSSILIAAENSCSKGFFSWLCFASIGFALLSVYGIQFFSSWKLASALNVLTAALVIVFINYFYYIDFYPNALKEFSNFLSKYLTVNDPLIVFINILLGILMILYGIAMGFYRNKLPDGSEEV